ncbi:MAG: carboxymuconolactone decarboxylase family protein [Thermogemmatispora sp.]|uniref:carboxymuconolactone decarboxylase family protein n=1 Tax=Thermogemmatispora sp. TaxID=1968838 RepID=UPI002603C898|nr:carboxymuconolactone decarboxylase family protein [Thermogemmatispora sp.]MBX5457906.1 carboxymuconolactone decarboxylase family protein [Thermogemmatispora sp.]
MSRIPPVEDSNFWPVDAEGESNQTQAFATMQELFRVMAHRPEVARQTMQLLQTVMRSGSVEPRLKELLAIRVSQVNYCHY